MSFVEQLAHARARESPASPRFAAALAWQRRLTRLLSVAAAIAFAQSLVADDEACTAGGVDGEAPTYSDLLCREA